MTYLFIKNYQIQNYFFIAKNEKLSSEFPYLGLSIVNHLPKIIIQNY